MEAEQRRAAKEQMMALMQTGHGGQEAGAEAGLQVSRSTAYRLLRQVRSRGKAAFEDGRHGHPAKLRTDERAWLETYCHTSPGTPSRVVQTAFQERFGIQISLGYLNQVRAHLGLGSRTHEVEKKRDSSLRSRTPVARGCRGIAPGCGSRGVWSALHSGNCRVCLYSLCRFAPGASFSAVSSHAGANPALSRGGRTGSHLGSAQLHRGWARRAHGQ